MIMQRQPDGSYSQIGFIKTKSGETIDKIVDKNGNIYFTQGFTKSVSGVPPLTLNLIGKPIISYKIYGNSVQNGTPTYESPIEVKNVGELVTEGEFSGKYEIPVVTKSGNNEVRTSIFLDESLMKIGNYADYIATESGKFIRNSQKIVFDGTENWIMNSNRTCTCLVGLPYLGDFSQRLQIKCTHFSVVEQGDMYSENIDTGVAFGARAADRICIRIKDYKLSDYVDFFKTEYAKGTPVTVYYPLAEPIEESTEFPEIPTFKGTTTIETDTEILPSNMEITYKSKKEN